MSIEGSMHTVFVTPSLIPTNPFFGRRFAPPCFAPPCPPPRHSAPELLRKVLVRGVGVRRAAAGAGEEAVQESFDEKL
jgi:hypothetical protein